MIFVVPFKYYILPKRTHGSLSGFREFRCVIGGTSERSEPRPKRDCTDFVGAISYFSALTSKLRL